MPGLNESCLLSVRAIAQRTVEPDETIMHASMVAIAASKSVAQQQLEIAVQSLSDGFADLGGLPERADAPHEALSWGAHSMRTEAEHRHDKNGSQATGQHIASVTLQVGVRDFTLLTGVLDALTSRDDITLHGMSWQVDEDNPAWSLVRADAIRGALIKGQDYATALGGRVERVQHVADAGLLGGEAVSTPHRQATALALRGTRRTSLNPEPQVVTAVIDARLITTVGALPERPAD
ncbi:SIMPL domain-containing protein [uncultured Jatrophihabitans sp.]|uniref:SIMPL domain-containing protein n=1 Tax=uncultured Jatrophihabitans sp. TaxID=1610747 RepID=UPI0035CC957B